MRKLLFQWLLGLVGGLFSLTVWAQELYQVEIIVFQHNRNALQEQLAPNAPLPTVNQATPLRPYNGRRQAYHLLPTSAFQLSSQATKLTQDPTYTVLLHQAWLQPIPHPRSARAVHIKALELEQTESTLPFYQWKLNGTLTLSQLNYFQVTVDLMLNVPLNEAQRLNITIPYAALGRNIISIPFQYRRRLRADQLYYLDHPVYAMLIQIKPPA